MSEREATLTRGPSTPHGILGEYVSDSGFTAKSVERPWVENLQGVSCVPPEPLTTPIRYLMKWQWSHKHGKNLYHLIGVDGREEIEAHSANVFEQLLGCVALGEEVAVFEAGSLPHGLPTVDMEGVTNSVTTMEKFEADMREDGEQVDFWLTIQ